MKLPARFQPVAAAFEKKRGVTCEEGWGEGNLVLKKRGKIFAMLVRGALVAKLPRARVDELCAAKIGTRFDPRKNGRVMKEWIVLAAGQADWRAFAAEAFDFASR